MYEMKEYDQDDYKRQLGCLLNQKNKLQLNGSSDNPAPGTLGHIRKRKPTPYHSKTTKSKLTTDNLNGIGQVLFDLNSFDYADSGRYQNIEADVNTSSFHSPNKLSKSKKTVKFSHLPNSKKKKSVKILSTPYPADKNFLASTSKVKKNVLFSSQDIDLDYADSSEENENISDEPLDLFSVSLSESPKRNNKKEILNKQKHKNMIRVKDLVTSPVKQTFNNAMKASELICDNAKYQKMLKKSTCFLLEDMSDSDNSDSVELELNTENLSTSLTIEDSVLISNHTNLVGNETEESNSLNENEDFSEDPNLGTSDDEIYEERSAENNDLDLREKIVGEAEYFPINNFLVILLHSNSKLYLHGLTTVTMLHGAIEVLGYTLTTSSSPAEIFSPRGSSFLYFETKGERISALDQEDVTNALLKIGMKSEMATELCQNLQPGSAVILCKNICKPEIEFLEKHISQQVFPKDEYPMSKCIFQNKIGNWSVFQPSAEWDLLTNCINSTSKLFICGGKSVGKSTLLRYTINKLLLNYSEILVIDLDPGQPEFTISGCISATIVKEPVFGPNYTHLKESSRCLFIPNINISYQPDGYLATIKELILSCSDLPKMPTIINYMGFTRGLGLEIFSAVVAHVQPTSLVEIRSSNRRRNFKKLLTYELICDRAKLLASKVDFIQEFPIYTIESMADRNEGWHLEPRQIREMCVLSYLSKNFPKDVLSLTDSRVPVFVIDLSLIKIISNGEIVSPSVVNANLVALCSTRVPASSYTCYGWGVVRGINLPTNELFLLTNISPDQLEKVDYLILGSVSLPPSLYMTSDNNMGLVPFVSQGVLTTLGQIPKRSHLPPRHKQV